MKFNCLEVMLSTRCSLFSYVTSLMCSLHGQGSRLQLRDAASVRHSLLYTALHKFSNRKSVLFTFQTSLVMCNTNYLCASVGALDMVVVTLGGRRDM